MAPAVPDSRASSSLLLIVSLLAPLAANAEEPFTDAARAIGEDTTRFFAGTSSAVVGATPVLTAAWGGYDGAARTPIFNVATELRIVRRLALVAGVAYGPASASSSGLRPQLGTRLQLLDQASAGLDASATVVFRQDRFTAEDGLLQGTLSFGRTFGATAAVLNLVYAQDGEGDDHEGEVRLAALHRARGGLSFGAEARYMHSIDSTDPRRAELGTPSMEAMAGPLLAYMTGRWTFAAEAGVSTRRTSPSRLDTGVVTLGGIGTTF